MKNIPDIPFIDILLSVITFAVALYFALDYYRDKKYFRLILSIIIVIIGGYGSFTSIKSSLKNNKRQETVDSTLSDHEDRLIDLKSLEAIEKLGNKCVSSHDRLSYIRLENLTENFDEKRDAAIIQIAKVKSYYSTNYRLQGVRIERFDMDKNIINESYIPTKTLISILLLDSQSLFRARSAQLLSTRNEEYVHEALILSSFIDDDLLVMQNSIKAFENLTGFKNLVELDPYGNLGFWYTKMEEIRVGLVNNEINILPLQEVKEMIIEKFQNNEREPMFSWYSTGYEMCDILEIEKKIKPKTGGNIL